MVEVIGLTRVNERGRPKPIPVLFLINQRGEPGLGLVTVIYLKQRENTFLGRSEDRLSILDPMLRFNLLGKVRMKAKKQKQKKRGTVPA